MSTRPKYRANAHWYDECLKPSGKADGAYYFRSNLELRCAQELELMRRAGKIQSWAHEPCTYDFNDRGGKYKRFTTYKPDFWVQVNGDGYCIEVKGYPAPGSVTKIRRFLKHVSEHELRVYTNKGTLSAKEWLEKQKRSK